MLQISRTPMARRTGHDDLPEVIKTFIRSMNTGDMHGLLECFGPGAILVDRGQKYQGRKELAAWVGGESIRPRTRLVVAGWMPFFRGHRVTVGVIGNGFNDTCEMNFQLLDGKIALLRVSETE